MFVTLFYENKSPVLISNSLGLHVFSTIMKIRRTGHIPGDTKAFCTSPKCTFKLGAFNVIDVGNISPLTGYLQVFQSFVKLKKYNWVDLTGFEVPRLGSIKTGS